MFNIETKLIILIFLVLVKMSFLEEKILIYCFHEKHYSLFVIFCLHTYIGR